MPIKLKFYQRGTLLMAAVVLVLIIVAMVTAMSFLSVSDIGASGNHMSSAQAYFISRSGLQRALFQLKSCTACDATSNQNNLAVGAGDFSTTFTTYPVPGTTATLNGAITNTATKIPVTIGGGNPITNFAGHGSITIDSETIYYSGTSTQASVCGTAPCFTGATRGAAGSTAAAHSSGAAVTQPSQCLIRSTGVAGAASRILESAVQLAAPGNLQLKKGAAVLASNQFIIQAASAGLPPDATHWPQNAGILVYRDAGAAANAQYDVFATANVAPNANGILAEVKMLVINGVPPNSSFQDGQCISLGPTGSPATILSHSSNVPAGDNVVLAALQFDNPNTGTRSCGKKGKLILSRGATTLWTNNFDEECTASTIVRRSNGYLVVARDPSAPANPTYTFTGIDDNASPPPRTNGEVKMLVINGVSSAFRYSGADVIVQFEAATSMLGGALATTFPAGSNAVLGFIEYRQQNTANPMNSLLATKENIVFGGAPVSSNQFNLNIGFDGDANDYVDSFLWGQTGAAANPSYDLQAQADLNDADDPPTPTSCTNKGICGRGSLVALHLPTLYYLDWNSIQVQTSATNIGSTTNIAGYNPAAGDNLIIAQVSFRNTNGIGPPIPAIAGANPAAAVIDTQEIFP